MEWNVEAIDRLRAFWAEGHSTAEIGRRMGVSKNAVVGKAHRLNLPARPSPIRRDVVAALRPAPARRHTLPPLRAALREPLPQLGSTQPQRRPEVGMAALPAIVTARPVSAARPFPRVGLKTCCWPIGEPGTQSFTFCVAEAMVAKPYCTKHAAIAYVKVRDRREDAA
ncbi:MAG: GcrA cell cycle regulator [Rubritepida sp.]|nr:GcrA cell cycle regulator [Rubritepida sp.]